LARTNTARIEFDAFQKLFQQNLGADGKAVLEEFRKSGLPDIPVTQMVFEYTIANPLRRDQWYDFAPDVGKSVLDLGIRLQRFHALPFSRDFIGSMKPIRPDLYRSLEELPRVLERYGKYLLGLSSYPLADRRLVQSRVLYLLFLALKQARAGDSNYKIQKSIAALVRGGLATHGKGENITYKTIGNRIDRFVERHSREAEHARTAVNRFGVTSVPMLHSFIHQRYGFLMMLIE